MNKHNRPYKILVIDPAIRNPERESFKTLPRSKVSYQYWSILEKGVPTIKDFSDCQGLIVFGSHHSVNTTASWSEELESLLKSYFQKGLPYLGICYGHQLLAKIFGGIIGNNPMGQQKGKRRIEIPSLSLAEEIPVSHNEQILRLPEKFQSLATSTVCEHEVISHENQPFWGIQTHPEAAHDFFERQSISMSDEDQRVLILKSRDFMSALVDNIFK